MNISVIIPNFNGAGILLNNLPKVWDSIRNYKNGKAEIIVADDNSTDDSVNVISNFIKSHSDTNIEIRLLTSNKNKGFSSNVNRGVDIAKGEILILLNSDVEPSEDFLAPLLKHFDDEKVFAVGCLDESIENNKKILRGRGIGKWRKGFLIHSAGEHDSNSTLWVSGGSGAFRKSVWEKLRGLDSLFDPFYWEDIDLSYRARKAGYLTLFEKNSIVRHDHDSGIIKNKFTPSNIKKIAFRNQFIFVWKNADFNTLIFHIFWLPYHMLKAITAGDLSFMVGFTLALVKLPRIIKSRSRARKSFIKKDTDVILEF